MDNIGCVDVVLGAGALARLDAVSAVERGFPHDFITGGRESFMGKITDQVDDHRRTAV